MNHLEFDITCPCCGGSLFVVNDAHPTSTEATLVAWCEPCRREWSLSVRLVASPGRVNGRAVRPPQHRRAVECQAAS